MLLKESFPCCRKRKPTKILYISGNGTFLYFGKLLIFQQQEVTFRARKGKKTHSLRFHETELSGHKLRVFHHCFFRCFHFSSPIFTTVFQGFSLLIAFFHVTSFAASLSGTSFLCCCTARATDLRGLFYSQAFFTLHSFPTFATVPQVLRISESFLYSQAFLTLRSFPTFGTNCLELKVLPWRLQGLPMRFEIQTRPICLFESHFETVFSKK